MKNGVQPGRTMDMVPAANANAGALVVFGQMFGTWETSAVVGVTAAMQVGGVVSGLRKLNGASTSAAIGASAYWDATNSNVTISATSNLKLGVFTAAVANADVTCTLRLNDSF